MVTHSQIHVINFAVKHIQLRCVSLFMRNLGGSHFCHLVMHHMKNIFVLPGPEKNGIVELFCIG